MFELRGSKSPEKRRQPHFVCSEPIMCALRLTTAIAETICGVTSPSKMSVMLTLFINYMRTKLRRDGWRFFFVLVHCEWIASQAPKIKTKTKCNIIYIICPRCLRNEMENKYHKYSIKIIFFRGIFSLSLSFSSPRLTRNFTSKQLKIPFDNWFHIK